MAKSGVLHFKTLPHKYSERQIVWMFLLSFDSQL